MYIRFIPFFLEFTRRLRYDRPIEAQPYGKTPNLVVHLNFSSIAPIVNFNENYTLMVDPLLDTRGGDAASAL